MANDLGTALNCAVYHGQMDMEDRKASQMSFSSCSTGVLVATTAFLVGIHIPNIDGVLWVTLPDHLINLVQGLGRRGRDGRRCFARVLVSAQLPDFYYKKAPQHHRATVDQFIQLDAAHPVCRRRVLARYFDGDKTRLTCRDEEEYCDVCARRSKRALRDSFDATTPDRTAVCTPVRNQTPRSLPMSNAQHTLRFDAASSPAYRIPSSRPTPSRTFLYHYPQSTGSPATPTGPIETPRKKRHVDYLPPPTLSPFSTGQEPDVFYTLAKQNRQLDFYANTYSDEIAERSKLFFEELPTIQNFWMNYCVVCFVERRSFDYDCTLCDYGFIGRLVNDWRRTKIRGGFGKGMCWSCLMPCNCCP